VQKVENFAAFLGRSPDAASFEDVWRYQLHPAASGVGVPQPDRLDVAESGRGWWPAPTEHDARAAANVAPMKKAPLWAPIEQTLS
jgi:hypothetical protein